jgi:hypothetical protein
VVAEKLRGDVRKSSIGHFHYKIWKLSAGSGYSVALRVLEGIPGMARHYYLPDPESLVSGDSRMDKEFA